MYDFKVNDIRVRFRRHAKKRLKERGISPKEVAWRLHDRYNTLKHYKYSNENLCYKSGGFSMILNIHDRMIEVITVMNFEAEYVRDAVVI